MREKFPNDESLNLTEAQLENFFVDEPVGQENIVLHENNNNSNTMTRV